MNNFKERVRKNISELPESPEFKEKLLKLFDKTVEEDTWSEKLKKIFATMDEIERLQKKESHGHDDNQ